MSTITMAAVPFDPLKYMKELEKEMENTLKQSIKKLDAKTINQSELLRCDLKLWFGGMLVTLILAFSTLVNLIPHLAGH